jgi:hypothetical protein
MNNCLISVVPCNLVPNSLIASSPAIVAKALNCIDGGRTQIQSAENCICDRQQMASRSVGECEIREKNLPVNSHVFRQMENDTTMTTARHCRVCVARSVITHRTNSKSKNGRRVAELNEREREREWCDDNRGCHSNLCLVGYTVTVAMLVCWGWFV